MSMQLLALLNAQDAKVTAIQAGIDALRAEVAALMEIVAPKPSSYELKRKLARLNEEIIGTKRDAEIAARKLHLNLAEVNAEIAKAGGTRTMPANYG